MSQETPNSTGGGTDTIVPAGDFTFTDRWIKPTYVKAVTVTCTTPTRVELYRITKSSIDLIDVKLMDYTGVVQWFFGNGLLMPQGISIIVKNCSAGDRVKILFQGVNV